jgi:LysR family glycine cleavage system transcriptional activator
MSALRSFEAVARLGSVTQAAEELHVTHSAVSHQIKLLEELLGTPLFLREGRNLRLTEDGRMYAMQVRRGLGDIAEATRLAQARPREDELVVAVLPSFGLRWLLPRLPRFYQRHPHYRVTLSASLDVQDIRQGLVDIAVRIGLGQWEGLHCKPLFDDELVAVAAPHFNGGRLPSTPAELLACPLVRTPDSWQAWCRAAGVEEPLKTGLGANDSNLLIEAVRLGQAVSVTRRSLVQALLDDGQLVQVTGLTVPYPNPHWLVWPAREGAETKQRDFTLWIEQEVADYLQEREAAGRLFDVGG